MEHSAVKTNMIYKSPNHNVEVKVHINECHRVFFLQKKSLAKIGIQQN